MLLQGQYSKPCSTKGGLIVYVNDSYKATQTKSLNTFSSWKGQIVKITEGGLQKQINIVNIYQPPKDKNDKYHEFIQELSTVLTTIERENSECIISGDFNIDLLKLNEKEVICEFFDTLTESVFFPKNNTSNTILKKT